MSNREAFEEWYSGTYRETIHILPNGKYASLRQQHSWDAWQARVPEGYVVVPVDKLMDCLYQISDRSYVDDNVSEIKSMIEAAGK